MRRISLSFVFVFVVITAFAQMNSIENVLCDHARKTMVVIRQDYQLVDDDEGEIKNAPGKEFWDRTYSFGIKVGEDKLLISGDAVRPWSKESFSKNDRFQPAISSTAVRDLDAIEFEELGFDESELEQLVDKRLYCISGSEEPGFAVVMPQGHLSGYALIAVQSDNNDGTYRVDVIPMTYTFSSAKNFYVPVVPLPNKAFGGVFVAPMSLRPGLVDYCVVGMFQKIGGVWKLVCPEAEFDIRPGMGSYDYIFALECAVNKASNDIDEAFNTLLNVHE